MLAHRRPLIPGSPAAHRRLWSAIALTVALAGCHAKQQPVDGVAATFTLPAPGSPPDLANVPWPSDLYLDASGHPAVGSFSPLTESSYTDVLRADLARHDGFGVVSGAFFPVPTGIDAGSLDGHALLLDLDGGDPVPVTASLRLDGFLSVRPQNGHVLWQRHHYAYVLTSGITVGGKPLVAAPDFAALRDASARPTEARLAHGWDVHQKLFAGLRQHSIHGAPELSAVVNSAVFTTQSVTATLQAGRDVVHAEPVSTPQVAYIFAADPTANDTGSLDELMGKTTATRPGCLVDCTNAETGIAHGHMAFVVQGAFTVPDFLAATQPSTDPTQPNATVQGTLQLDDQGRPKVLGHTEIPFTLVLPVLPPGATYANTPVIIHQHGLGGDREGLIAVADDYAAAGMATFGIDMAFHGRRAKGAVDLHHNIGCGLPDEHGQVGCRPGPDGLADDNGNAFLYFFDAFSNGGDAQPLDPAAIRAAFQTAVLDLMSVPRVLSEASFAALGARDSRLAGLSFKPGPYFYVAESFGSVMGSMLLAVEPQVGAAELVVGGGGIITSIAVWSPDFEPAAGPLIQSAAQVETTAGTPETDYWYNLMEMLVEPGDPLAYAPYIVRRPLPGLASKHILGVEAYEDETVPNIAGEALYSAMGLQAVQTTAGGTPRFDYLQPTPVITPAPVMGNVTIGSSTVTAALVQMQVATHGMLARQEGHRTRDTRDRNFTPLPMPQTISNPIEAVQGMGVSFAADFYAGRVPVVADPR